MAPKEAVVADQPSVEVVDNPNAGQGTDGRDLARWFRDFLKKKVPRARYTNVLDERECRALEGRLRRDGADVIVAKGGDGTLQQWLTRTLPILIAAGHKLPLIIIVKCGTMNVAAGDLGAVGPDVKRTLQGIIEKMSAGVELDVVHRHVLEIDGEYCLIFGALMISSLLGRYYENREPGRPLGVRRAARVAAGVLLEETRALVFARRREPAIEPIPIEVCLRRPDGTRISEHIADASGLVVSTLTQIGIGLQPTYRSLERHDAFHLIATRGSFWKFVRNMPDFRSGRASSSYAVDEIATEAEITLDRERDYTLDGEWRNGRVIRIRLGPRLAFVRS